MKISTGFIVFGLSFALPLYLAATLLKFTGLPFPTFREVLQLFSFALALLFVLIAVDFTVERITTVLIKKVRRAIKGGKKK